MTDVTTIGHLPSADTPTLQDFVPLSQTRNGITTTVKAPLTQIAALGAGVSQVVSSDGSIVASPSTGVVGLKLAGSGVTPGTYSNVTVNAQGIVTVGGSSGGNPSSSSVINFYAYSPSSEGSTGVQTTVIQNFLLYCQLVALSLRKEALIDQDCRTWVTAYFPEGYYNVDCPIIVPELVNLQCDGTFVRNGSSGTVTNNYTGDTTSKALANLSQPTVIIVPRGHSSKLEVYSNSDGVNSGAGIFVGRNWTVSTFTVAVAGTGYHVGDVLTCANPSKSPYICSTATVATINGAGGVTSVTVTEAGAYALPPVLQTQQWTTANGFTGPIAINNLGSVFSGGALLTTGGNGSGCTLTPTWVTDWTSSSTAYNMGHGGLVADTVLGNIRTLQVPTTTDATYGPMTAFRAYGLNFTIDELQIYGGRNGIDFTHASDCRINVINSIKATNPILCIDSSSINCPNVVIDTPSGPAIFDRCVGAVLKGRWLFRNVQNSVSPTATIQCGLLSSGTDLNTGLDLTFELSAAGSGNSNPSLAGNPALYLAYTAESSFNLKIDNNPFGYAPSQPTVITSYVQFGTNAGSSCTLIGAIDYRSGFPTPSLFSGTNPGCGVNIWDSQLLGYAGPNNIYTLTGNGAPTNGGSGTGATKAGPGSTYTDYTNKVAYLNTGTQASPTWTAQGGGGGSGTVTSAGYTGDGVVFNATVTGSPITTSGTFVPALLTQTKNTVLAGPGTGSNATPTFRTLVGADLPNPTLTTLGGIQAVTAVAHEWITSITTSGVPNLRQPNASDISGLGTIATQAAGNVTISGGAIDGTTIGGTTPSTGAFTTLSTTGNLTAANFVGALYFNMNNGTSVLTTGAQKIYLVAPYNGTITSWTLIGNVSGSIVLDIWKTPFASFPPTVANTITGSALPTLSSAQTATSSTLTGWTTTFSKGDIFEININSATTLDSAQLTLELTRT